MGSFTRLRGTSYLYNPSTGMFSQVSDLPSFVDDSAPAINITGSFGGGTDTQAFYDALAKDYEEQLATQEVEDLFTNQLAYQPPDDFVGPPEPEDDGIAMVDLVPEVPGVVTDDPNQIWKDTDKDELDLKGFIDLAFDVFGAYNKDAITNVVDLVNQRGISVGEVAQATGNSVESINQAATESGTAIENQGTGEITVKDEGPAIGPQPSVTVDEGPAIGPQLPTGTGNDTVVGGNGDDTVVVSDVFPEGDTVISDQTEQPTIITGPRGEKGDPGKTGLIMALAQQAPITEQMFSRELFEPQLRELANVPKALGMIQAIGRRFV